MKIKTWDKYLFVIFLLMMIIGIYFLNTENHVGLGAILSISGAFWWGYMNRVLLEYEGEKDENYYKLKERIEGEENGL